MLSKEEKGNLAYCIGKLERGLNDTKWEWYEDCKNRIRDNFPPERYEEYIKYIVEKLGL